MSDKTPEPCDLKHRTVASIIAHTLVQLVGVVVVAGLAFYGKVSGELALATVSAIVGFQLQQLVKGRPPTSLVFALFEGTRYISDRFA